MRQSSDTQFLVERRRTPRYFCPGNVEIIQGGRCWGWGKVRDLSRSGCYVETSNPLPSGAQAYLRLTIADTFLELATNVTCTQPRVGMGVDFVLESPAQQRKLEQILEGVKPRRVQRREFYRIELRQEARYCDLAFNASGTRDWRTAELHDVSLGGASLWMQDEAVAIRQEFRLDVALNRTVFSVSAAVRRVEIRKGRDDARLTALEYLDLDRRQQDSMARAIVQLQIAIINSRLQMR